MRDQNIVILAGRLVRDPKICYAKSGSQMCYITIATSREYVKGGERRQDTEYVDVTLFGDNVVMLAEQKKGSAVFLAGKLHSYRLEDGKTKLSVIADNVSVVPTHMMDYESPNEKEKERQIHNNSDKLDDIPF